MAKSNPEVEDSLAARKTDIGSSPGDKKKGLVAKSDPEVEDKDRAWRLREKM